MDVVTIVICMALVLLAIISTFCNILNRRNFICSDSITADALFPAFSIIITVHDNAKEIERNLPAILNQNYPVGFEVIVVDESSTDETVDVLKRLKNTYSNLYTTFIPETSHYISRRKLALTIGIKAAKNEWLIITDADCCPQSEFWLQTIAKYCTEKNDMVIGYANYSRNAKTFYRFEHLLTTCYAMLAAHKGVAFRCNCRNLAIRKSIFMEHHGFLKNLRYLRGEYDFIVNEFAIKERTAIVTEEDGKLVQDEPSNKKWKNEHVFYMETRRHLERKFANRILFNIDNILLHITYLAEIIAIAYSAINSNWIIFASAIFSLILTITLRIFIASKTLKLLNEPMPLWRVPLMEIRIMWQNLVFMVKYAISDKNDFIRK